MLNLVMTHSPHLAAIANNKRVGDESLRSPALKHRIDWLRDRHEPNPKAAKQTAERAFRERTA